MKWQIKSRPQIGDIRIKEKFLLFPKSTNDEYRWLEKAKWKEKYVRTYSKDYGYFDSWECIEFIDN